RVDDELERRPGETEQGLEDGLLRLAEHGARRVVQDVEAASRRSWPEPERGAVQRREGRRRVRETGRASLGAAEAPLVQDEDLDVAAAAEHSEQPQLGRGGTE